MGTEGVIKTDTGREKQRLQEHIRELQSAALRTNHLVDVFRRIRSAVGGGCEALCQSICDGLTAAGGYTSARITLAAGGSTLRLSAGTSPAGAGPGGSGEFVIPIEHAGRSYGRLAVTIGTRADPDSTERALLSLIAADLGRAVGDIGRRHDDPGGMLGEEEVLRDCFEGVSVGMAFIRDHDLPLFVNQAFADFLGYEVDELDRIPASQALERISDPEDYRKELRLLHELMDRRSPSYTIEKRFRRKNGEVVTGLLTTTFFFDREDNFRFRVSSVQDITEHVRTREELQRAYEGAIDALVVALESRDPYTAGHQRRVTQLACAIADGIGLPEANRMGLEVASILHDIGKIAIPAEILTKPYGVSEAEYSLIRAHPRLAHDILKEIHFPWPVADIVVQHHERLDGSGYPEGLTGNAIRFEARILSVADVVEALASHRPYRPASAIRDVMSYLEEQRGTLFDPRVVDACLRVFEHGFEFERPASPSRAEHALD